MKTQPAIYALEMKAADRRLLRLCILRVLQPAGAQGLALAAVARHCAGNGFDLSPMQLAAELCALEDKGLLTGHVCTLSAGLRRYGLSPAGRAHLEREDPL